MRIEVFDRLDEAAPLWDEAAPEDFFFARPFLRVMQDSGVEGARYRYLVLLRDRRPAAVAVLSCFTLKLDLLSRDVWTRLTRRVAPALMDVPIICCGIPASYGQHHLHAARQQDLSEAVPHVHRFMEDWAAQERCSMLFWKEWHPAEAGRARLVDCGYLPLPTLPDHRIADLDDDPAHFLGRLRSAYRRQYRAAAALMCGPGPVWEHGPLRLEEMSFAPALASEFHRGYARVMERTDVRLETYPAAFFRELAVSSVDCFALRLTNTSTTESMTALMYRGGRVLTFGLISKEQARYGAGLYRILLQCMVLYAIAHGYGELRLGQTSAYAKCGSGARPWRLETLVRVRSGWKHRILKRGGSRLFPEVESPPLSVYRAS
jgi:hypothetical protein